MEHAGLVVRVGIRLMFRARQRCLLTVVVVRYISSFVVRFRFLCCHTSDPVSSSDVSRHNTTEPISNRQFNVLYHV